MTVRAVEEAIRQVRKQLEDFDLFNYGQRYNETATRYALINPVLKGLGWDINDMDQCAVEWPVPPDKPIGRADYVLNDSQNQIVIVIEAKHATFNVGGEPSWLENKLAGYTMGMPWGVAVLTNGLIWRLYWLDATRQPFSNRIAAKVDIRSVDGGITEPARSLYDWLDKDLWW